MIRGLYTSSAGMQVESLRQEAISNNLANVNTSGFRKDMAIMEARGGMKLARTNSTTSSQPLANTKRVPLGELGSGVMLSRFVKSFEQGDLRDTQNEFDLALTGEGFFTLQTPQGETVYSRAGEFTRDGKGHVVDKAGNALMGLKGPISVGSRSGQFQVSLEGTVAQGGNPLDRLAVVNFESPDQDLEKLGDTNFRFRGAENGRSPQRSKAEVHQGMLEGANVNSVQSMVEMIAALRQYEANQKALQGQDETLAKAVNEIAKG